MITFQLTQTEGVVTGTLEYREADLAFDTTPRPIGAVSSLTLNEVELMTGESNGRLLFVAGGIVPSTAGRLPVSVHPRRGPLSCYPD